MRLRRESELSEASSEASTTSELSLASIDIRWGGKQMECELEGSRVMGEEWCSNGVR